MMLVAFDVIQDCFTHVLRDDYACKRDKVQPHDFAKLYAAILAAQYHLGKTLNEIDLGTNDVEGIVETVGFLTNEPRVVTALCKELAKAQGAKRSDGHPDLSPWGWRAGKFIAGLLGIEDVRATLRIGLILPQFYVSGLQKEAGLDEQYNRAERYIARIGQYGYGVEVARAGYAFVLQFKNRLSGKSSESPDLNDLVGYLKAFASHHDIPISDIEEFE